MIASRRRKTKGSRSLGFEILQSLFPIFENNGDDKSKLNYIIQTDIQTHTYSTYTHARLNHLDKHLATNIYLVKFGIFAAPAQDPPLSQWPVVYDYLHILYNNHSVFIGSISMQPVKH